MFPQIATITLLSLLFLFSRCEETAEEASDVSYDIAEESTTNSTEPDFPGPSNRIDDMIGAAKVFIGRYLNGDKWHKLKRLLATVREIGGTREDSYRAVSIFLSRVLTSDQKKEIVTRRQELYKLFGDKK